MKFNKLFVPRKIDSLRHALKEKGLKKFLLEMGWKAALAIVLFYFIRDTILYLLIPYLIARGFLSGN